MTLETWTNQSTTATNTILKRKWNTIQYNLFTYLHLTSLNSMLFSTYKYNKCTRWFLLCEKSYECNAIFNTFNLFYSFNVRFNLALYVMIQDLFLIVNELPSANNLIKNRDLTFCLNRKVHNGSLLHDEKPIKVAISWICYYKMISIEVF